MIDMSIRSILSAAIAIAICSPAIGGVQASEVSKNLDSTSFDSYIAEGATFVKFYSPECVHSQKLAPTWEQVASEHQGWEKTRGFKFGEVDCLTNSDICEDNDVTSYPTMKVFYKGKPVSRYSKKRTAEVLGEFVAAMSAEYINVAEDVNSKEVGEVKVNALGKVITLDQESYDRRIKHGPWFIEYYAPWCGHCKALAPVWELLAEELQGKVNVGKVDCTKNEDICRKNPVPGFPTLLLHQYGRSIEFRKKRTPEGLIEFALGAINPSIEQVELAQIPLIKATNDVSFIYMYDDHTDSKITNIMEKQSQIYYEQINIYGSKDSALADKLSVPRPSLVVLKDNHQIRYEGSLTDDQAIEAWIDQVQNPLVRTLDNSNIGTVLGRSGWSIIGLVELANAEETERTRLELIETALEYQKNIDQHKALDGRHLRFAVLNATQWEGYIRGALKLRLTDLPAVLVINSRDEEFYPFGLDGRRPAVEKEALLKYIREIEEGVLQPRSMLSFVQKGFREVQSRFRIVTQFTGQHPMASMAVGTAFLMALMRLLGGKAPEEDEKKEQEAEHPKAE
ncbi:hypothetical protein BGW38_000002 [Lunasporangiospora selenospora]|uniref:Thioredoxin domain-containing protein n=1 Tax=Lunasporangiospora selenospora TaxID=979761 RepID=A0A9P6KJ15_9FUNG|nr:hypothetical protein BGW38_000002 [Lunasporangiospora selenospora]